MQPCWFWVSRPFSPGLDSGRLTLQAPVPRPLVSRLLAEFGPQEAAVGGWRAGGRGSQGVSPSPSVLRWRLWQLLPLSLGSSSRPEASHSPSFLWATPGPGLGRHHLLPLSPQPRSARQAPAMAGPRIASRSAFGFYISFISLH